ncbi:hypothetical protein [Ulvibacterium sp.]|uniref:hypothetical protein n=1 Tax=Ulvibacterium sp. TaxID=2665914 RepID=UPI00261CE0FE|nr:hypothetical protein [Ulvibacterium sp.]
MILITLGLFVMVLTLFYPQNKGELTVGEKIHFNRIECKKTITTVEEIRFKSSIECVKHYNKLVCKLAKQNTDYDLDAWTHNTFVISNGSLEVSRFGNHIRLRKTLEK